MFVVTGSSVSSHHTFIALKGIPMKEAFLVLLLLGLGPSSESNTDRIQNLEGHSVVHFALRCKLYF